MQISLKFKREHLKRYPRQNQQQSHLLQQIDNLLKVLKSPRSETEKQKKKEADECVVIPSQPLPPPPTFIAPSQVPATLSTPYICPHTDKPKIVKGMCFYCYNKMGRTKKANKCEHTDKLSYCQGLCQPCYLHKYYVNRRKLKQDQKTQL